MEASKNLSACARRRPGAILDAETANEEMVKLHEQIGELKNEVARLRSELVPLHWITAPVAAKYLEAFAPRLVSAIERDYVKVIILAIKRLQGDPQATAWWQCREVKEGQAP